MLNNPFVKSFNSANGNSRLEKLTEHSNKKIVELAERLISKYYEIDGLEEEFQS